MKNNNHDLSLPAWGPYSKKYAGISHITDAKEGIRFDLSVFPGLYRRKIDVPNVMMEGAYHIWEANTDLTYFSTRHEIQEKDQVYCDISYGKIQQDGYLIEMECVNHSSDTQNLVLHYMASIHYPTVNHKGTLTEIAPISWNYPAKSLYCHAIDYQAFYRKHPLPTDSLVPDGLRPNEIRGEHFSGGSGVLLPTESEGSVSFALSNPYYFEEPVLVLRYQAAKVCTIKIQGNGISAQETLPDTQQPQLATIFISGLKLSQNLVFTICVTEGTCILDSFIFCEKQDIHQITCSVQQPDHTPLVWEMGADTPLNQNNTFFPGLEKSTVEQQKILILKYPFSEKFYGLYWDYPDFCLRYWLTDELDYSLRYLAHDHVHKQIVLNNKGHFTNVFMRPIPLTSGKHLKLYGLVCCGDSRKEVEQKLTKMIADRTNFSQYMQALEKSSLKFEPNPQGIPYIFSQERMIATTLTNVVYPIYTKRKYIRHNTPGRWWDCLYTWDSGFVGLGLTCCDIQRAIDCLNAYVTEPGDTETAFIHHGSPVPVQFYLFQELYQRTQSKDLLMYFYPRLMQYYRFMTGQSGSSTTNPWKSGLLCTWDYFYNSGGWDDYPPQVAVHALNLESSTAGVITTSHMIRCAKILIGAAEILGERDNDICNLHQDIARFTKTIQDFCWDEDSGYFGYLVHDTDGNPLEIFRHDSGQNFNMGLDGASPMVAGIVTPRQLSRLLQHLSAPTHLWTPIGLSTVDQSAAYYKKDGYWNGAVWMPHQWFFFKALLDYGQGDLAFQIAKTGLDVWKNEVDQSYNCYEHFIITSGRGAGWHHFSGLSTPVLLWYQSYYVPGTITTGFSGFITNQVWDSEYQQMECTLHFSDLSSPKSVIIVMKAGCLYQVNVNGKPVDIQMPVDGTVTFTVQEKICDIKITPKKPTKN